MLIAGLFLSLVLAPVPPLQDDACAARPADCRVTSGFTLRVGDKEMPVEGGQTMPWVMEDGALILFQGESVVIDVTGDKPVVISHGDADAVLGDGETKARIEDLEPIAGTEEVLPLSGPSRRPAGPSGRVRLSFRQAPDSDEMLLVVENGYDAPLRYKAAMIVPAQSGMEWNRTSVCTVMPGIPALEHWPHPILAMAFKDLAVDPALPRDRVACE